MYLKELPHLKTPEVTFPLAYNVLLVNAQLSKMIVETKYYLMRNNSDVLFSGMNQDPFKNSPFVFQQVQHKGHLAIIAEDCTLSGFTIASLSCFTNAPYSGEVIDLGHDTFRVSNCKFSLEISAAGLGSPPIIAPYFSKEQRRLLENLLSTPIRKELMTKLQSVVYAYLNTFTFDIDVPGYRKEEKKIFKETYEFVHEVVQSTNKWNMLKNQTSRDLRSLEIRWTETYNGKESNNLLALKNVVVYGLDSAYFSHVGGPYKLQTIGITEALRYNTLKVRGKIFFQGLNVTSEHEFFAELLDVTVNVELDMEDKSKSSFKTDTYVSWRNMVFSITNLAKPVSKRIAAESFVSGYLINEIPTCLPRTLRQSKEFINKTEYVHMNLPDPNTFEEVDQNANEEATALNSAAYVDSNSMPEEKSNSMPEEKSNSLPEEKSNSMPEEKLNSIVKEESDKIVKEVTNKMFEKESEGMVEEVLNDKEKLKTELIIRKALPDTRKMRSSWLTYSSDEE